MSTRRTISDRAADSALESLAAKLQAIEEEARADLTDTVRSTPGLFDTATLQAQVAFERENGRAFGPLAEACREELAKRTDEASQ